MSPVTPFMSHIRLYYRSKGFTPLEKIHPVRNLFLTGQASKVGGENKEADGDSIPPSAYTARPVRKEFSNRVKERSSLTGFTQTLFVFLYYVAQSKGGVTG